MITNLEEIFEVYAKEFEDLSGKTSADTSSYKFENQFNTLLKKFVRSIYQYMVGKVPKSKNERITILTSQGDINFPIKSAFGNSSRRF